MEKSQPTVAHQIAQAAVTFEQQRTGNVPESVAVVLSDDTLVITLHGALSPAEKALAQSPEGAAQVQEFHRELFNSSAGALRQEIRRITGVDVREASAEVQPATGTVVHAFTTGTVVQVFLLAGSAACEQLARERSERGSPYRDSPSLRRTEMTLKALRALILAANGMQDGHLLSAYSALLEEGSDTAFSVNTTATQLAGRIWQCPDDLPKSCEMVFQVLRAHCGCADLAQAVGTA